MYISNSQQFVSDNTSCLLGNLNFQWPVVTYACIERTGSHTVSIHEHTNYDAEKAIFCLCGHAKITIRLLPFNSCV